MQEFERRYVQSLRDSSIRYELLKPVTYNLQRENVQLRKENQATNMQVRIVSFQLEEAQATFAKQIAEVRRPKWKQIAGAGLLGIAIGTAIKKTLMKEIFEEFGLKPSVWLLSIFVAAIMAMYRIFEKEPTPGTREILLICLGALICVILVPGTIFYAFKIDNPFIIAAATALCVHNFEKYLRKAQKKFDEKLNLIDDGKDA